MKKIWETGIILFATMGFWGMIYPDLCFTQDVCQIVEEECEEQYEKDMFTLLCETDSDRIRVKSKLLETLKRESKGKENVVNKR